MIETRAVVVVPTYNERENVVKLFEGIAALGLGKSLHLLFVDDNSPDGTGQIADDLARQHDNVHVLHRTGKGGRGSAVVAGFRWALDSTNAERILEMDADYSHDPVEIPRLLEITELFDMASGSRYLPKSRIVNWNLRRRIFSRCANLFARFWLDIPLSDYTNGFRCYTREALESIPFDRLKCPGYILLSEMAYLLKFGGFEFAETPIVFFNRERGASNLSLKEITSAVWGVLAIRWFYQTLTQKLRSRKTPATRPTPVSIKPPTT